MDINNLPAHPVAALFPTITGDTEAGIRASMERFGYRKERPLLVWQRPGTKEVFLADGLNRRRIAKAVGVKPSWEWYEGSEEDLVELIWDVNVHLRTLNLYQQIELTEQAQEYLAGLAKERMLAGTLAPGGGQGRTREKVAKLLNAGKTSVDRYNRIKKKGSKKLQAEARAGRISLHRADELAKLSAREQAKYLNENAKGSQQRQEAWDRETFLERARKKAKATLHWLTKYKPEAGTDEAEALALAGTLVELLSGAD